MKHVRNIILAAAVLAAMLPALASAQPSACADARICWAWRNTCTKYVYIFGRPVCTRWTLTCIQWL